MKKKIIVLGAGLVGKAMALDLARDFEVMATDFNPDALSSLKNQGINTLQLDFSKVDELKKTIAPFDIVAIFLVLTSRAKRPKMSPKSCSFKN
jgi:saccharopine dehydrogenase-like NADP-dependent oxidoreductase